ncbi:MAG: glyoxalase [Gemmatimonadetes bacterium]|jgi:catechol 2,3-dioxygenase-like lactoylglutathione lyase family enzyme|nr:glyoxalase [Gemmatimonadota bacterium]
MARVLETALYVADLAASRRFYVEALGAAVLLDTARLLALGVGGTSVLLLFTRGTTEEALPTPGGVVPGHGAHGRQHVAFAIAAESLGAWRTHLLGAGIEIESEVSWPRGGHSLYVRDPDAHSVELVTPGLWTIYGAA